MAIRLRPDGEGREERIWIGKVWNIRRNHFGWRMYLRGRAGERVSPYAADHYYAAND